MRERVRPCVCVYVCVCRRGSAIIDSEAIVAQSTEKESASTLVVALKAMEGQNMTIAGQTAAATMKFGNMPCEETIFPIMHALLV